jgi:uncharacterized protein (TIGR03437 family)
MVFLKSWVALTVLAVAGQAQVLSNQYLTGKYYFRHLSFGTDAKGGLTDGRTLSGTMTFDGAGNFTYTGTLAVGSGAPAAQSGSGKYSVDPAGFVALDNKVRAVGQVNARIGPEALVGSSTETTDGSFDLLVAIPAPTKAPAFTGTYWTATLEFPGGTAARARNGIFALNPAAGGKLADFTVSGHAADIANGAPQSQAVTGATYVVNADGTGTFTFGAASTSAVLSGPRNVFVSNSGNVVLGGSGQDILLGVKAVASATNATWNGDYWGAGFRYDPTDAAPVSAYSGSIAARGLGFVTWSRRYKGLGAGAFDFTGVNRYTLNGDGSGTAELARVGLGTAGFVGTSLDATAPNAFELYVGALMAPVSGTGVFLNPRGVVNTASYAPAGTPIAPGEFITLFGAGLARSTQQISALPFPLTLNGVTVTINGKQAPLYYVAADRIYAVVPYATQGPTATIVVANQNGTSNTVTVPVAASTPGIFALDQSGAGSGAILHGDFTVVNDANPARKGEAIQIYLSGLGAVNSPPADGRPGGSNPLSTTVIPGGTSCDNNSLCVLIGGKPAEILYAGLAPGLPGVYQINALVPAIATAGKIPLAVVTPNAVHDQVYVPVQ